MVEDRRERWERVVEWPLIVVALLFLAAYAIPIVFPGVSGAVKAACGVIIWASWGVYLTDYLVRIALSQDRWLFVKTNWLDLAVVALPLLRPLRLVRLLALLRIFSRTSQRELRGRVAFYAGGSAILAIVIASLAVTDAERGAPGSNIEGIGDGFWWALSTMATVGYGDRVPVTVTGRFIASVLMVGGVALLGVVTATIASWLVQKISEVTEAEEGVTRSQVEELHREISALREEIAKLGERRLADEGVDAG